MVAELEGRPISDAAVRSAPEPCTVLCNILSSWSFSPIAKFGHSQPTFTAIELNTRDEFVCETSQFVTSVCET